MRKLGDQPQLRSGAFANGMDFLVWGSGTKVLLFIPGGPGSSVPEGMALRLSRRWFAPFVEAGYAVWMVTRRRQMPSGHSVADMAADYAEVIVENLGGRVEVVVGVSFGGMIAQYLAADHAPRCGRVAIVAAAAQVSAWGREVDSRLSAALASGDRLGFGMAFAEYALPSDRSRWLRRLVAPWIGRQLLPGTHYPPSDLLVEVEAEISFDSRPVLPRIGLPVVVIGGDRDRFFPWSIVEETARLIPGCALVRYDGYGHLNVAASRRVPDDVLAWASRG